jgi:hypothetical protein
MKQISRKNKKQKEESIMTKLRVSARELDPTIKYIPFEVSEREEKVLFLSNTLVEEVISAPPKQQQRKVKQLKKILQGFLVIAGVSMLSAPAAMAAPAGLETNITLTPDSVMQWGLTVALISVSVGVALSMTMLTIAGIYRMFRKRKEAAEWTEDVIKGLVQVLVAVPTTYLLFYLAQAVFKNLPMLSGLF